MIDIDYPRLNESITAINSGKKLTTELAISGVFLAMLTNGNFVGLPKHFLGFEVRAAEIQDELIKIGAATRWEAGICPTRAAMEIGLNLLKRDYILYVLASLGLKPSKVITPL